MNDPETAYESRTTNDPASSKTVPVSFILTINQFVTGHCAGASESRIHCLVALAPAAV